MHKCDLKSLHGPLDPSLCGFTAVKLSASIHDYWLTRPFSSRLNAPLLTSLVNATVQKYLLLIFQVTRVVWGSVAWLDRHHESLLGSILLSWLIHLTFSFLLIAGAVRHRRDLFLPWLCSDMVILVLMVATFTFTCFLSFFVDLLVAIVFPVVAGLVLGVWSLLWHRVRAAYLAMGVGGNPEDPWSSQTGVMSRKSLRSRMAAVLQWRWRRRSGSGSGQLH